MTDDLIHHPFKEEVDALMLEDFQSRIEEIGLKLEATFGDYQLNAFDEDESERLILIVRKREFRGDHIVCRESASRNCRIVPFAKGSGDEDVLGICWGVHSWLASFTCYQMHIRCWVRKLDFGWLLVSFYRYSLRLSPVVWSTGITIIMERIFLGWFLPHFPFTLS